MSAAVAETPVPPTAREMALLGQARQRLGKLTAALTAGDRAAARWNLFELRNEVESLSLELDWPGRQRRGR